MTTKKSGSTWRKSPPGLIEKFTRVMERFKDANPRKMFGYPSCFVQDRMCTGLHQENWIIRLREEDRLEIFMEHQTTPFEPMKGRIMKEYVILPEEILADEKLLLSWIERSIQYVKSLPPKPPKKPSKRVSKK